MADHGHRLRRCPYRHRHFRPYRLPHRDYHDYPQQKGGGSGRGDRPAGPGARCGGAGDGVSPEHGRHRGPRAELYRDFAALVEDTAGLRPVLWDERRTTVDAHRILFEAGKNARKRKKTVDAVAASLILEGYLDHRRLRG